MALTRSDALDALARMAREQAVEDGVSGVVNYAGELEYGTVGELKASWEEQMYAFGVPPRPHQTVNAEHRDAGFGPADALRELGEAFAELGQESLLPTVRALDGLGRVVERRIRRSRRFLEWALPTMMLAGVLVVATGSIGGWPHLFWTGVAVVSLAGALGLYVEKVPDEGAGPSLAQLEREADYALWLQDPWWAEYLGADGEAMLARAQKEAHREYRGRREREALREAGAALARGLGGECTTEASVKWRRGRPGIPPPQPPPTADVAGTVRGRVESPGSPLGLGTVQKLPTDYGFRWLTGEGVCTVRLHDDGLTLPEVTGATLDDLVPIAKVPQGEVWAPPGWPNGLYLVARDDGGGLYRVHGIVREERPK